MTACPEWTDAFEAFREQKGTKATCYSWRLDRCLFWTNPAPGRALADGASGRDGGGGGLLRATALALGGKKQVGSLTFAAKNGGQKKLFPSDHSALLVTLELSSRGVDVAGVAARGLPSQPAAGSADVDDNGGNGGDGGGGNRKRKAPNAPSKASSSAAEGVDVVYLSD